MPDLYEAIFKRKSVRKYDMTPLSEEKLQEIQEFAASAKPLNPEIKIQLEYVSRNDVTNFLPGVAPHYIAAFSEKREGYLTNMGFILQQVDLYLSFTGLGSCWFGVAKPSSEIRSRSDLDFVIILAFGKAVGSPYRKNAAEFRRKPFDRFASGSGEWLEAVRLAPSASNGQPWYFVCYGNRFDAYCTRLNMIKALIYEKINKVDMGIALCHLWLAVEHSGGRVSFMYDNGSRKTNAPKGYNYTISGVID